MSRTASALPIKNSLFEIEINEEDLFVPHASLVPEKYSKKYLLSEGVDHSSKIGINGGRIGQPPQSCLIISFGFSRLNENSAVIVDELLYLAVGNRICSFDLSRFTLNWHREVDQSSCFGVYYSPSHHCIFTHGEQEIARVSLNGEVEWRESGADIFTEGFELLTDHIEVVDLNHEKYSSDPIDGQIRLANS